MVPVNNLRMTVNEWLQYSINCKYRKLSNCEINTTEECEYLTCPDEIIRKGDLYNECLQKTKVIS